MGVGGVIGFEFFGACDFGGGAFFWGTSWGGGREKAAVAVPGIDFPVWAAIGDGEGTGIGVVGGGSSGGRGIGAEGLGEFGDGGVLGGGVFAVAGEAGEEFGGSEGGVWFLECLGGFAAGEVSAVGGFPEIGEGSEPGEFPCVIFLTVFVNSGRGDILFFLFSSVLFCRRRSCRRSCRRCVGAFRLFMRRWCRRSCRRWCRRLRRWCRR